MRKEWIRHSDTLMLANQVIGATQYCCQQHVKTALATVYLPHIEKSQKYESVCKFCGRNAEFQYSLLH